MQSVSGLAVACNKLQGYTMNQFMSITIPRPNESLAPIADAKTVIVVLGTRKVLHRAFCVSSDVSATTTDHLSLLPVDIFARCWASTRVCLESSRPLVHLLGALSWARPWHSLSNFASHLWGDSGFFGSLRPEPGGRQAAPLVQQPRPLPLGAPSSVLLLSDGGGRVEKQTATLQTLLLLLVVVVVGLLLRSSPFQRPLEFFPASETGTMSETCSWWIVQCKG